MLDIAQNSVRAGASLIEISLEQERAAHKQTIVIKDNGCGMDEEKLQRVTDPFFTTRTTRKVGLGIPFYRMAAEQTGGEFLIESAVGVGTTVTAVFVTDHIDCMPLGDMTQTVVSLIGCNPDLDFIYSYSVDGKRFVADTRQFRQQLEGVPLNTYEVLRFIEDYINENVSALNEGGAEQKESEGYL